MKSTTREMYVGDFNKAFGHPVNVDMNTDELLLRFALIEEEFNELSDEIALANDKLSLGEPIDNKADLLKELADLQYVISGFAVVFGLPLSTAFNRVHKSNLSKLGVDGKPLKRGDGKILKGPNYQKPYLEDLVR